MFFILILFFIMIHESLLSMTSNLSQGQLDIFYSKITRTLEKHEQTVNEFVNRKCTDVLDTARFITGELNKNFRAYSSEIRSCLDAQEKKLNNINLLIDQILEGTALAQIHDELALTRALKVQLLDELIHLNAYRQGVEQWRVTVDNQLSVLQQKVNNLTMLDQKVDRLEQKYVLLQHDAALVDLSSVTNQVNLFHAAMKTFYTVCEQHLTVISQRAATLNTLKDATDEAKNNLYKAMIKYKTDIENQVNSDIKKLNDDILNRLDINTKAMNDMQHVNKKTMYSMAGVCGVLFLLILYQQYQLYCLQAKIQNI